MRPDYHSILDLRELVDDAARGYRYEQVIREVVPWTYRPPIAIVARSEQIDAFFEWNSWHFLVEAKAKLAPITEGSPDWEDFELKLRRRGPGVIGLYCSLFDVRPAVVEAATRLNHAGLTTIVLAGTFWDELAAEDLALTDVLRYMVFHARAKQLAAPPPLAKVRSHAIDLEAMERDADNVFRQASARFLRRHRSPRHDRIYVDREVDKSITGFAAALKPSALERTLRTKKRARQDSQDPYVYEAARVKPSQVAIIRDASGAGKTTAAVQMASTREFFGVARAALDPDIDDLLGVLDAVGTSHGLDVLRKLNRPVVVVIDSLDEAGHLPGKPTEVNALLRGLDDLNDAARRRGMVAFPLGVVLTVREEYWERWHAFVEGRDPVMLRQRLSTFTEPELDRALARYTAAYNFTLAAPPGPKARRILEVPFNLQVFAEANEYQGVVDTDEVLSEGVLSLYFQRKREEVMKRYVPGLSADGFMLLASSVAMQLVRECRSELTQAKIAHVAAHALPKLKAEAEELVRILRSEQIVIPSSDDAREFRFRHTRFVEYLVAYYIAKRVAAGADHAFLARATDEVFAAPAISMFRVHDLIKVLCSQEFQTATQRLDEFYTGSSQFMERNLARLRTQAGYGGRATREELSLVIRASSTHRPDVAHDAFFVLAARPNGQPEAVVLDAFDVAWKATSGDPRRWKLLQKLHDLGLIASERAFAAVMGSDDPREWEVYLGALLEREERDVFVGFCKEAHATPRLGRDPAWDQARHLLDIAISDRPYIPGDESH